MSSPEVLKYLQGVHDGVRRNFRVGPSADPDLFVICNFKIKIYLICIYPRPIVQEGLFSLAETVRPPRAELLNKLES